MPTSTPKCPECGTLLPIDAPQGLCPKCLLRHGMDVTIASSEPQPTIIAKPIVRYFGEYELDHEIARGGMGAVFKARQVKLNRPVAVKMILEGLLADEAMVKRFYTEAEAAANLQHPNIVAIHEIGAYDGQHYFSMDYVDGKDLSKLTGGKPLSPAKAARYVQSMAGAIHYAHQRGTLHRDLKPSNVLIDEHDQPRITDFGLAKLTNSGSNLTVDGAVMGTPSYMSPEQANGRQDQIGPHSDVYSLGAILYELLTGKPPFQAATLMATMRAVIESDVIAPRKLNPDIPVDLETICLKCLEKTPQRRYASARELSEELGRFLKNEPILARPASAIRRTASWLKRHPGQLAALTALVMLGLSVFIFYLTEQNAFLRAQLSNPGLTRQRGPLAASVKQWRDISSTATTFGLCVWFWFILQSRGVKGRDRWSALFNRDIHFRPMHPVGSILRGVMFLGGAINLVCAALLIGSIIRAYVWEGVTPRLLEGLRAEVLIWLGLFLPWLALQNYRLSVFGGSNRELPSDVTESIRRAASDSDIVGAIRIYRQAVPEASLTEAREHVLRLMERLGIRPPSLAVLNLRRMAAGAGIVGLVVGVLWYLFPPSQLLPAVGFFGAGVFLGLTFTALPRIRGTGWRILFMLPPILVLCLVNALRGSILSSPVGPPYFFGIMCGIVLMLCGLTPAPRKTTIASETE